MGQSTLGALYGALKKVNTVCATIGGLVLLFITLSIFVDVFMRYVLGKPTIWITEVSTYLFLYVIYLATAYALQKGDHIKVTFFVDFCSKRIQRWIDLVTQIMGVLFTAVLLWQTSAMTWSAHQGQVDHPHHAERALCIHPRDHGARLIPPPPELHLHHHSVFHGRGERARRRGLRGGIP